MRRRRLPCTVVRLPSSTATAWSRLTTPKARCSASPDFRRLLPRTVGGIAGGCNPRGALLLRRGGLGTGGRHHPPYPTTLRTPKVNFGEIVKSECRKILLPRTNTVPVY